jgi:lipopolysaccharide assembly outer membrane protein LptD (OstA)
MDNRFYKSNVRARRDAWVPPDASPEKQGVSRPLCPESGGAGRGFAAAAACRPGTAAGGARAAAAGQPVLARGHPGRRAPAATHLRRGDSIRGRTDLDTTVEGNAELRRGDTIIRARKLEYNQPDDLARATGDVRINKAGNIFEGPLLELKVDASRASSTSRATASCATTPTARADRIDFLDEDRAVIRNATYTTCQRQPGPSWMPDWILRAASISLDQQEETGYATGAVLSFKGVPILPVPALSFPSATSASRACCRPPSAWTVRAARADTALLLEYRAES